MTRRWPACALIACVVAGCGAPEDSVEGTIESDAPLATPIGGEPACLVEIRGRRSRPSGPTTARTFVDSGPRLAPGARFVVDGRSLRIDGDVHSSGGALEMGESWRGEGPAPEGLARYGPDGRSAVACHPASGQPPASCTASARYELTEYFARCGATVRLRGHVEAGRFVPHDHRADEAGGALAVLGSMGACVLCPVLVLVGAIAGVVALVSRRRAKRSGA